MACTKEFFLPITHRIFSNWTALRLTVEHGMGSKENAIELCTYMTDLLYMNENLSCDDVATELWELVDEWFNTELEDNSHVHVAEDLLKFYRLCMEGNEAAALEELNKLPPLQPWLFSTQSAQRSKQNPNRRTLESESSSDSDDSGTNLGDIESLNKSTYQWTTVKKRQRF